MSKTVLNIKIQYEQFSKAEKKIADFLMENPDHILPLYITELAEKCGTSEATIVRFAKRLGFEGYQQLKIAIAQEAETRPINENITPNDSASDIFTKVCDDIYCSLEKTKKAIDNNSLEQCCTSLFSSYEKERFLDEQKNKPFAPVTTVMTFTQKELSKKANISFISFSKNGSL